MPSTPTRSRNFVAGTRLSVPLFYKLKAQGKGPVTFYAGVRQLVSREAAAAWRHEREAVT